MIPITNISSGKLKELLIKLRKEDTLIIFYTTQEQQIPIGMIPLFANAKGAVVVLGNYISPYNIKEKNGIRYTDFNRTLSDAFANETILNMQGTIEALSKYYYTNGESFDGISVAPEYQNRFDSLADEAIE